MDYNGSFEYDQNEECAPNAATSFPLQSNNIIQLRRTTMDKHLV